MLLAAVSSWFNDFEEFEQHESWVKVLAITVALAHATWALIYCSRNLLLCVKNVEYSDKQLARIFDKYKRDEVIFQTLIDSQLAVIANVQKFLDGDSGWGEKFKTLAKQVKIAMGLG